MQASTHLIKGNLGFEFSKRRVLPCFGKVTELNLTLDCNICFRSGSICSGLNSGAVSMGAEPARARNGIETVVRSSVKSRSIKAQASGGDIEDLKLINPQGKSSGMVLPFVGVACLGAILFGYPSRVYTNSTQKERALVSWF
ncbi:plastidic glucose transporter 4-like isoform X2 [Durio zibethinus]|uniref:Plastidic glucose transporter 4-like isoform X2 n=1 Tax=Durio zibethinus TaxID=66656 RepID=A0A6P5ZC06_DURZI|nr:plastidic glucose transporter 4-like isoform X2 [Durio zibethinus]